MIAHIDNAYPAVLVFALERLHYFHLGKFSWRWERHHSVPAEEKMTSVSPCRVTRGKIRLWIPNMFPKQEARYPNAYVGGSADRSSRTLNNPSCKKLVLHLGDGLEGAFEIISKCNAIQNVGKHQVR